MIIEVLIMKKEGELHMKLKFLEIIKNDSKKA